MENIYFIEKKLFYIYIISFNYSFIPNNIIIFWLNYKNNKLDNVLYSAFYYTLYIYYFLIKMLIKYIYIILYIYIYFFTYLLSLYEIKISNIWFTIIIQQKKIQIVFLTQFIS